MIKSALSPLPSTSTADVSQTSIQKHLSLPMTEKQKNLGGVSGIGPFAQHADSIPTVPSMLENNGSKPSAVGIWSSPPSHSQMYDENKLVAQRRFANQPQPAVPETSDGLLSGAYRTFKNVVKAVPQAVAYPFAKMLGVGDNIETNLKGYRDDLLANMSSNPQDRELQGQLGGYTHLAENLTAGSDDVSYGKPDLIRNLQQGSQAAYGLSGAASAGAMTGYLGRAVAPSVGFVGSYLPQIDKASRLGQFASALPSAIGMSVAARMNSPAINDATSAIVESPPTRSAWNSMPSQITGPVESVSNAAAKFLGEHPNVGRAAMALAPLGLSGPAQSASRLLSYPARAVMPSAMTAVSAAAANADRQNRESMGPVFDYALRYAAEDPNNPANRVHAAIVHALSGSATKEEAASRLDAMEANFVQESGLDDHIKEMMPQTPGQSLMQTQGEYARLKNLWLEPFSRAKGFLDQTGDPKMALASIEQNRQQAIASKSQEAKRLLDEHRDPATSSIAEDKIKPIVDRVFNHQQETAEDGDWISQIKSWFENLPQEYKIAMMLGVPLGMMGMGEEGVGGSALGLLPLAWALYQTGDYKKLIGDAGLGNSPMASKYKPNDSEIGYIKDLASGQRGRANAAVDALAQLPASRQKDILEWSLNHPEYGGMVGRLKTGLNYGYQKAVKDKLSSMLDDRQASAFFDVANSIWGK